MLCWVSEENRGLLQGRCLHCRPGRGCLKPPSLGVSGSSSLSIPAHQVSTSLSCPCWQLLLSPHLSSLPLLTDPIPPTMCSTLSCRHHLSLYNFQEYLYVFTGYGVAHSYQELRRTWLSGSSSKCRNTFPSPTSTQESKRREVEMQTPSLQEFLALIFLLKSPFQNTLGVLWNLTHRAASGQEESPA